MSASETPSHAEERRAEASARASLSTAIKCVAGAAVVLVLLALALADGAAAVGVALGGGLAVANLVLFVRLGRAFLERQGNAAPWAIIGLLKLLALFAAVAVVLRSGSVSALALAVGYGALPIGITLSSLFSPKPSP